MDLHRHEELGDILEAAGNTIKQVLRVARAINPAGDRDFAQAGIRFGKDRPVLGFKKQADLSHSSGGIGIVAGIDQIFGAFAAQTGRSLLAEHPADRVNDIRLATSVGSHHGGYPGLKVIIVGREMI